MGRAACWSSNWLYLLIPNFALLVHFCNYSVNFLLFLWYFLILYSDKHNIQVCIILLKIIKLDCFWEAKTILKKEGKISWNIFFRKMKGRQFWQVSVEQLFHENSIFTVFPLVSKFTILSIPLFYNMKLLLLHGTTWYSITTPQPQATPTRDFCCQIFVSDLDLKYVYFRAKFNFTRKKYQKNMCEQYFARHES